MEKVEKQIREAVKRHVGKSFPDKSDSEKKNLVRHYCKKVLGGIKNNKIMILQSRGFFMIDTEGNTVESEGAYCD